MKRNVKNLVESADESKKANPLDLSADQDLTIALMNLVAIEDATPDSQIGEMVRNIRENLMARMVSDDKIQVQAYEFLVQATRKIDKANKLLEAGDKKVAYEMYDAAYEDYVLYLATVYGLSA